MDSLFEALDGPLREAYQAVDWATTPLGPVSDWSETLVNAANLTLSSRFPITLLWGPEAVLVYNEAYVPLIGDKHPAALGWPAREVFPEAWEIIRHMVRTVLAGRGATWFEDRYVPLRRRGFLEECYFTFSYSPVRGRDGAVEGVMAVAAETTEEVLSRRRLRLLTQLRERLADVEQYEDIPRSALPLLRSTREDFPAVDIRLRGEPGDDGLGSPRGPGESSGHGGEMVEARGDGRVASFPCTSPTSSVQGTLVVSLSPRLAPDDHYLGFLRLVAESLRQALDRVRTRSAERRVLVAQRHMSEAFQRHLLPRPEGSGYPAVAVRYQPAAEVADIGGDWYDLFELPDESLMVVIGDVDGHDAAAKVAILANLVLDRPLSLADIETSGISHLTPADIEEAAANGRAWKLVATLAGDTARVRAEALPLAHPLAAVSGATNAVTFTTDYLGAVTLTGPGAGRLETGYAMIADLLEIGAL